MSAALWLWVRSEWTAAKKDLEAMEEREQTEDVDLKYPTYDERVI